MEQQELLIKMVIAEWQKQNARLDQLLDILSDEQLSGPTAPGRNSGIYLLGHLTAVNDGIIPLLGFGEKLHPGLEPLFLTNPENPAVERPPLTTLKKCWKEVNTLLDENISKMKTEDWFTRHSAVTAEAFLKEPQRNKLNILINRSSHQSYHLGQLAYLK